MIKKLEFELDEFNTEDEERFHKCIDQKDNINYTIYEMVITANDNQEWIGKPYPGNLE